MHRRTGNGRPFEEKVAYYFALCETIERLRGQVKPGEMIDVRHEDLISCPESSLERIGEFLGLEMSNDYLQDCASVVFSSPNRSRHGALWSDDLRAQVDRRISDFDFLAGYRFDL